MAAFKVGDGLTTREEIDSLPYLAVILNLGESPHAWQKRKAAIPEVLPSAWFCTTDEDYGTVTEDLLDDFDEFVILWLPPEVEPAT